MSIENNCIYYIKKTKFAIQILLTIYYIIINHYYCYTKASCVIKAHFNKTLATIPHKVNEISIVVVSTEMFVYIGMYAWNYFIIPYIYLI